MSSKEEIKRQIESLQAKLAEAPETPPAKRRKTNQGNLLAPSTPSPRKKPIAPQTSQIPTSPARKARSKQPVPNQRVAQEPNHVYSKRLSTAPSSSQPTFLLHLKALHASADDDHESAARTEGFEEKAPPTSVPIRDGRLAIVENLVPGPVEHKPVADDPDFARIEPNSGIRLKERSLLHTSLQDHLSGRYFFPPSLLYSIVRLQPNKQAYEVPVEGDWVTIAVVAERGDVKFTSGPGNAAHSKRPDDENEDVTGKRNGKEANKKRKKDDEDEDDETGRKGGKKYVHLKLVDLGHRSRSSASSSDVSRDSLRGDAQLSLLLFESDYYDKLIDKNGKEEKIQKLWRGGSGGAFEECYPRLREGTVIALLNPKVLKPFTNSKNPSSPMSSILALTPPSASAIAVIGYAADMGRCTVLRRDGKPCGSWVDMRISAGSKRSEAVCEYHVQAAVQRTRAGRAEFSIGTSGMSTTAAKRKSAYDPVRQWGLKPEGASRGPDGEATYVVGGLVASSGRAQTLGNVSSTMGREEQARARRKAGAHEEKALSELLGKSNAAAGSVSKEALLVVQKARDALLKASDPDTGDPKAPNVKMSTVSAGEDENRPRRKSFSAEMIKRLGFNPTIKAYGAVKTGVKPKKTDVLSKLGGPGSQKRDVQLGPPPGPKVRSGVTLGHLPTMKGTAVPPRSATAEVNDHTCQESEVDHSTNLLGKGSNAKAGIRGPYRVSISVESDSDSELEIEPPVPRPEMEMTAEGEM